MKKEKIEKIEDKKNLDFILKFNKITLTKICKKLKISKNNIYSGRMSEKTATMIKEEIESEIAKLYIKN